jgi:GT2 family glycosyltransferase
LTCRVQADAFFFNPAAYLQAVAWRLRGLRLRSRNRIAALAGRSPSAYALWIARDEPRLCRGHLVREAAKAGQVIPVIDCQESPAGIEATLQSLAKAGSSVPVIIIGGAPIAGTTNVSHPSEIAGAIADSETWLCPLRAGDRIAPGALDRYRIAASSAGRSRIVYSDDDLLLPGGERAEPHFKPAWNPELFENHDFLTGSAIVRVTRDSFSDLREDRWAEQLFAHALLCSDDPIHLPMVLHHRRTRPEPRVPAKPLDLVPSPAPSVTAIIPTRNHLPLLRKCVEGLRATAYPNVDLIIVDNGSDDPATLDYLAKAKADGVTVLRIPGPFNFSALNNAAARQAECDFLCFLNNDVEMTDPDWLSLLVRQAMRPEIGAVGARLLYADLTVQHAGVFIGIGGGAGHAHRLLRHDETGYFNRARLPQRVSAVTGACFVVAREKFLSVGGFDEQEFAVAFNDVDLCLKLNENGWQTFYEPRATLIHHESKSRGSDSSKPNRARFAAELAALKRKWHTDGQHDPYHHPHLSRFCEQFLISV